MSGSDSMRAFRVCAVRYLKVAVTSIILLALIYKIEIPRQSEEEYILKSSVVHSLV